MVYRGFRSLSPPGLLIEEVAIAPDRLLVKARCRAAAGQCPDCGRPSEQVHSRYERRLLDLPSHGRTVQMRVTVRRFRCAEPGCGRRIFAERLSDAVAGRSARRTSRLELIVRHFGIALGYDKDGRPVLTKEPKLLLNDDNAGKPEGIHLMIGRQPYAAFGNSVGDRQMLEYTKAGAGAPLAMLVLHDDGKREYAYGPPLGLPNTKVGTFTQALYDEAKKQG